MNVDLKLPPQPQQEAFTASQYNTIIFKLGFRKTFDLNPFFNVSVLRNKTSLFATRLGFEKGIC